MSRLCVILSCCALFFACDLARANDAARQARPPTEYNGRVQMYEMPAKVAPPRIPEVRSDPRKITGRDSEGPPSMTPMNSLTLLPPPSAPGGDPSAERDSSGRMRSSINDSWRGSDSKQTSPSSWGWLADDIATNRARRSAQQSSATALDDEDDDADHRSANRGVGSNQTSAVQGQNTQQGDRSSEGATQTASMDPVLSSFSDPFTASPTENKDIFAAPALDTQGRPNDGASSGSAIDADAYANWSPVSAALSAPSFSGTAADAAAERAAQRPMREVIEPTRIATTDARFSDPGRFSPSESPSMFSGSSFANGDSGFKPFEVNPVASAPLSIPASPTPLPSYSAPGYSAAPTPSVGGMGTERERERATPKTLPW